MMNSVNVLIMNVVNVHQQKDRWSGKMGEEKLVHAPAFEAKDAADDVIELTPKNGIWQATGEDAPALEPYRPYGRPSADRLTYTRQGGYAAASTTGARINLVV